MARLWAQSPGRQESMDRPQLSVLWDPCIGPQAHGLGKLVSSLGLGGQWLCPSVDSEGC